MNLWLMWLNTIKYVLDMLSSDAGLGLGLSIIIGTMLLRCVLLPISWPVAYRGYIRGRKMVKLQPALRILRKRFRDKPELYMQKMSELYRKHDLAIMDYKSVLGAAVQMPLLVGMYQVLGKLGGGVRFLWVANLMKPDFLMALIVAMTTALIMAVNPGMSEQTRIILIIVPCIFSFVVALKFSSALAIYWGTSNIFSGVQSLVLQSVVRHRIRTGELKI